MAAATLSAEERQTILSSAGAPLAASRALPLMGGGKKVDPISPPASFGDSIQVRYGTIPTYTPYVQERWELVAYVNSMVIDDVAQPVYRESSVSGALNDAYGMGRLSTVGGTEALPVADTYLEDGLGSVSAVVAGDGRIAASYAYSPWGEAAVDVGEFGGPALSGLGYQPELSHYGYNGEESTGASGLQYLRARWYDPTAGAFGSQDAYLGDAADPATLNRYAYVEGNPIASCDPTGHVSAAKNRAKKQQAAKKRATKQSTVRKATVKKLKKTSVFSKISTGIKKIRSAQRSATIWAPLKKATRQIVTAAKQSGYTSGGSGGGGSGWKSAGYSSRRSAGKSTPRSTYRAAASSKYAKTFQAVTRTLCGSAAHMGSAVSKGHDIDWAEVGHGALDLLGFIPGFGAAADVVNGLWYAAEGNYVDAALSFVSAVPGAGDAAAGAKLGKKAAGAIRALDTADSAQAAARAAKKATGGGAYKDVRTPGREAHHMPAKSVSPLSEREGPAISMAPTDHRQTASWGRREEAKAYREKQKQLIEQGRFKEAQQMDVDDIRSNFGDKYDREISQMQDYTNELERKGLI